MNIWKHSLLSQRKFGGKPQDYIHIHRFIDSSKLFLYHVKHRLLIHNLYGVELCMDLFGDYIINSDNKMVVVRDIAVEHCREDLSGTMPTLNDWLVEADATLAPLIQVPDIQNIKLKSFVMRPYLRSGLKSSLVITCSDFGVYLAERFLDLDAALELRELLPKQQTVSAILGRFTFAHRWQYTPDRNELAWLQEQEEGIAE